MTIRKRNYMKTNRLIVMGALLLGMHPSQAWNGDVTVETPTIRLLLHADEGQDLRMAYFGSKSATLQALRDAGEDANFAALPAFGTVDMIHLPAVQLQHANGDQNLELKVTDYTTADDGSAIIHTITMKDKLQPVTVQVFYKAYKTVDVIETWTVISHQEKKAITLKRFDSGHLAIRRGDVWLTHLHGDWASETEVTQEPLTRGLKTIRNSDGARNSHLDAPEIMLSLDGQPQENTGRTIGAALCWNGNFEIRINTTDKDFHHLYAGIAPQASEYVLEPKQLFETPHLALSYSEEGMGGVSRNFHRWARTCGMLHRGMNMGNILLNSWEGLYFDINEERMLQMMDDISKLGGELFVMDDGWFGDKYQRNNDSSTLGDWVVDKKKLPNGLKVLTDGTKQRGIKFGIWIEPEMANTKSELFEKHPEWVLQTKGRELKLGRGGTQVVLDMTNPQVQDFVFKVVDDLMTQNPEIAYIKWDANASIQNLGSLNLPMTKQSNLYVDYHLGLLKVLQRIREKYPDLIMQDCASGGGRANYGLLPYYDEFWVSDNTDALQRVYIQWGTSLFFPANAMAAHINHCPYWNTGGRVIPVKFRCDVAMSGRLGIELQPKDMTQEERQQVETCFKDYKTLRPVVQTGNLYRLISPYDRKGLSSLMYVDDSQSQAVLFVYKVENLYGQTLPRVRLAGLNPHSVYTLQEMNVRNGQKPCSLDGKQFTGQFLMNVGIELPLREDYGSRVFLINGEQGRQQLLNRLTVLQQKGYMAGHQDDPFYGVNWAYEKGKSDVLLTVGDYPAVMGFDLGGIEMGDAKNLDSVPFTRIHDELIAHHERGGIVTLSWHPRNPVTTGEQGGRFPEGSSWDTSDSTVVRSVLPGGAQYERFQTWMQRVGDFIATLTDKDGKPVPIIFRPWHENNGSWFWWGQKLCSDDEFRGLWNMLQDYLRDERGFDNLLWSYSPNLDGQWTEERFLQRYPGNERVMLIGEDAYQWGTEEDFVRQVTADLDFISTFAKKNGKLIALTECGLKNMTDATWYTRVLQPVMDKYPLSYFLLWRNYKEEYFGPVPGTPCGDDYKKLYEAGNTLFLKDIISK